MIQRIFLLNSRLFKGFYCHQAFHNREYRFLPLPTIITKEMLRPRSINLMLHSNCFSITFCHCQNILR